MKRCHPSRWLVAIVLLTVVATLPCQGADNATSPVSRPWPDGEKLVYSISWGLVHAAEATFNAIESDERWEFQLHLISQGTVDTFYPINDWFWSYQQKTPWRSIEYGEDRSERTRRIRERTQVNYAAKIALREKWTKAETDRIPVTIEPLDDIGSMLYSMRCGEWKVGDKRVINVYESSSLKTGEAVCEAIETIPLDEQRKVEVFRMHCKPTGETKRKGELTFWMTRDERRLPLRAKLEFKYGTFDIVLTQSTPPYPPTITTP